MTTRFCDRHGQLTDDSDRWLSGHENTFESDPTPDWEGAEYDDWHRTPKCGGPKYIDQMTAHDYTDGRNVGCPGCRRCFPPDVEAIHTGFERYDRPDFYRVSRELTMLAEIGYALDPRGFHYPGGAVVRDAMIGFDARLLRAAQFKLARICDRCETHPEAVAEYAAWAQRAAAVCYPDQPRA